MISQIITPKNHFSLTEQKSSNIIKKLWLEKNKAVRVVRKCLVVVNFDSGNINKFSMDAVNRVLEGAYELELVHLDDDYAARVASGECEALAVCGGDGTLNSVLNKVRAFSVTVFYIPYGTLNEESKIRDIYSASENGKILVGKLDDTVFTYVVACGTFTPIGYTAKVENKKKYKLFAYLAEAVKEYRVHAVPAKICADGVCFDGDYTLIMVIKAPRCFGFRFNRMYKADSPTGHLLAIKSPGKDNLVNKVKIFFPFFRAFFQGFNRECEKGRVIFKEFSQLDLELSGEVAFDVDGEKVLLDGKRHFEIEELLPKLIVCKRK